MNWIKCNKHAVIGWGVILALVLMMRFDVLLGALGLKFDGWSTPIYAIRGPVHFVIFGGVGIGLYMLSINGHENGFRIRKSSLIPGLVLLLIFLLPWLWFADFYLHKNVIPDSIGIHDVDIFRLIQPLSTSAFSRFPEYLLYIVTGFLLARGIYGEKKPKE